MNKLLNRERDEEFGHYASLDGVRGIAVLLVVGAHLALLFPAPHASGGLLGVDVFFVLSGFLITSVLIKEFDTRGEISLKNFYARRFLRLMPAYWTLLALIYTLAFKILPTVEAGLVRADNTLISCVLYYSNLSRVGGQSLGVLTHTWSLSIEEQFYFLWAPLLYLMLTLLKRRLVMLLATATINILLVVILEYRIQQGVSTAYLFNAIECRLFAIMIGSLIAMVVAWRVLSPRFLASWAHSCCASVAFCAVLGLGLIFKESVTASYRILPPFALSVAFIIIWLVTRSRSMVHSVLTFPPLVWFGKRSYGLYLWHPIAIVATLQFGWPLWAQIPVALASSLLMTTMSYHLIELPCLKLKRKFSPTQAVTELPIDTKAVILST